MVSTYIEAELSAVDLARGGRTILRDVDWHVRPGERWLLAGGNGAGKTQLMKLLAGSVWPTPSGRELRRYRWRGTWHRTPAPVLEHIAYLGPERQDKYERYGWNHTVEQIVGTGLYRSDIPLDPLTARDRRRITALLGQLGIGELATRGFLTLSYGERRLALLARALAARPQLLLLDELLNGLDHVHHARALRWLAGLKRRRLPWVLATHRVEDIPHGITHALLLDRGRVVFRGPLARAPLARWLAGPRTGRIRQHAGAPPTRARARVLVRLTRASVYLSETRVLSGISLTVRAGECWVVHGRNGAGKSTLIRTLYGDHAVAAGGWIERAGVTPGVPLETFKRGVGLIAPHLQSQLPGELTVSEVVQSGRHASFGLVERATLADRRAGRQALGFFGLEHLGARPLQTLSYGQQRRVLFARAWVNHPALLLLDEPFAGVDAPTRRALLEHLESLAARGVSLVLATHRRAEWPQCASHELELLAGRARYCGPVRMEAAVRPAAAERTAPGRYAQ
jgi:molybdate transport system ATP-binding protein